MFNNFEIELTSLIAVNVTKSLENVKCYGCEIGSTSIRSLFGNKLSKTFIAILIGSLCQYLEPLVGGTCDETQYLKINGVLDVFLDDYFQVDTFCTYVIPACNQDSVKVRNMEADIQEILSGKDEEARKNTFINELYKTLEPTSNPIKIAMITDGTEFLNKTEGRSSRDG